MKRCHDAMLQMHLHYCNSSQRITFQILTDFTSMADVSQFFHAPCSRMRQKYRAVCHPSTKNASQIPEQNIKGVMSIIKDASYRYGGREHQR